MHRTPIRLVVLALLALAGCGQSPGRVAQEYVECTVRGDVDGMKALAGGKAAEDLADPKMALAAGMAVAMIERMGGVSGCEIVEETVDNDAATVLVKLIPKDPGNEGAKVLANPRTVRLSRIDGQWKVVED